MPLGIGQTPYLSFLGVCCLTAATLVVAGFVGEFTKGKAPHRTNRGLQSPKRSKSSRQSFASMDTFNQISGRIMSVGLPIFAASKLGGARVAVVMAVALAADLVPSGAGSRERNPRDRPSALHTQKWTICVLLLQILLDITGLSGNYLPLQAASGYLALTASVLMLPPPYSVGTKNSSLATSRMRSDSVPPPSLLLTLSGFGGSGSPMVSTAEEIDFTIASGVLSTVLSFVVFVSSQQPPKLTLSLLAGGTSVSVMFAISLLFADPVVMKSRHKTGLALGLISSVVLQGLIDPSPMLLLISQTVLATFSWTGIYLDTHLSYPHASQHHHHDHSHHHHDHSARSREAHSRITGVLLLASEGFPLLHSILLEKDSRRILYFMLYALLSTVPTMIADQILASISGSCLCRPSTPYLPAHWVS